MSGKICLEQTLKYDKSGRKFRPVEEDIEEVMSEKGLRYEIVDRVRCGYKSPAEDRYCFDIKIL